MEDAGGGDDAFGAEDADGAHDVEESEDLGAAGGDEEADEGEGADEERPFVSYEPVAFVLGGHEEDDGFDPEDGSGDPAEDFAGEGVVAVEPDGEEDRWDGGECGDHHREGELVLCALGERGESSETPSGGGRHASTLPKASSLYAPQLGVLSVGCAYARAHWLDTVAVGSFVS